MICSAGAKLVKKKEIIINNNKWFWFGLDYKNRFWKFVEDVKIF
jgi:hypothetical protein